MKTWGWGRRKVAGFTLLELLLVAVIIAILAALLLPVVQRAKGRSRQVECLSQLRQVGLAYHTFAHDHSSRFPFQTPVREGGTLEMVQGAAGLGDVQYAFRHFQALSNDLAALPLLVCPSDPRTNAATFQALRNDHISYFVAVTADPGRPDSILGGDRNIVLKDGGSGPILRIPPGANVAWSRAGHEYKGNLLFADGHVERKTSAGLQSAFQGSPTPVSAWMPVGGVGSGLAGSGGVRPGSSGNGTSSGGGGNGSGGSSGGAGSGANSPSGFTLLQNVFNNTTGPEASHSVPGLPTPAMIPPAPPAAPRNQEAEAEAKPVPVAAAIVKTNPPAAAIEAPMAPSADPELAAGSGLFLVLAEPERCSWCWWLLLAVCVGAALWLGMLIQRRRQAGKTVQPKASG